MTDALVSTQWLAVRLNDPSILIVDASYFVPGGIAPAKAQFAEGHLPGAYFFDINDVADPNGRKDHTFPTAAIFAAKVGALGITNAHHIIAYDYMGGACAAARVWWMFRHFGHEKVSVLDGGLKKWKAENRALSTEDPKILPAYFDTVATRSIVRSCTDMQANIVAKTWQTVYARAISPALAMCPSQPCLRVQPKPSKIKLRLKKLLSLLALICPNPSRPHAARA